MSRQPAPTPGKDLSEFPVATLEKATHVYRAHRPDFGPCFFNGTPAFRFNLLSGRGTSYVADNVETAVREKLREDVLGHSLIPASMAREFVVAAVLMDRSFACANVNHAAAVRHGVSRRLESMDDYDVPQKWAAAFDAAGFEGVRYGSSFTNGEENSWALFGEEGEHAFGSVTASLSGIAACQVAGIQVYEQPHSDELDTV
ncbi:RES family NAD+ phosphorylase [Leifsonia aquatica]|uniref:RES family NAD+ phosphorylase n=1 Tax=Leifsonia aquatica TaxID=144185 RepID=UPI00384DBADB